MLNIQKFEVNMLGENCYVVSDDSKECMIVDCGAYSKDDCNSIFTYIKENELKPVLHVLTHAHLDHIFGTKALFEEYGLRPIMQVQDEQLYKSVGNQASMFGLEVDEDMPPIERLVKDGDTVIFGFSTFRVIETPGHTRGSVFYYCEDEKVAFSGDTLFRGSIGRTDLPGGSMFQIIQSLRMITQYPDDTTVYPGHGPKTTIGYELATNMYLDR